MLISPFTDCARTPARILLVDDEGPFRDSLAELLRDDGHVVLAYSGPAEVPPLGGLERVDLLVTDFDMPGKNGLVFADEFHAHRPGVPVLLVTAYHARLELDVARRPFVRMISKPIGYDALHRIIHECAVPDSTRG
jgi:DNA-binding NtrC family response regulator